MKHGVPNGPTKHRKMGEEPCFECKEARRIYFAEWRARGGEKVRKREARNRKAREIALVELAKMHPQDYQALRLVALKKLPKS